jgi:hypothetical protein
MARAPSAPPRPPHISANDLALYMTSSDTARIGGAILRMTQDDAASAAARSRRQDMGLYVATLVQLHLDQNFSTDREISNRLCMSIDVQHGEVFQAPTANARRVNDLENACRLIAAFWPSA